MKVREFARAIREEHPDLRGTSDGGVRQYVQGQVRNPRVELLRAMADVLGVRRDWLEEDDGPMTDAELTAMDVAGVAVSGVARDPLGERLGLALADKLGIARPDGVPTWVPPLATVWVALTKAGVDDAQDVIAEAVACAASSLGLTLTDETDVGDFVLTMLPALLWAARHRAESSAKQRKNPRGPQQET